MNAFDGVKVFSSTMFADRETLGEKVTKWIADHKKTIEIVDITVTQSSDEAYHCTAISVFYLSKSKAKS